ncbi:phospholipase D-like domain-containing protein [Neobacillus sp. NPDC093182]|uniref:phospholipase D-like domain-containing protein n=1 Tax=Neobacillus sp. NPDC093182 TaxID=3364297 RepID=UPI0038212EF2
MYRNIIELTQKLNDQSFQDLCELVKCNQISSNSGVSSIRSAAARLSVDLRFLAEFIRSWKLQTIDKEGVLLALKSAYETKKLYEQNQARVDLAWNGPFSRKSVVTKSIFSTMIEMINTIKSDVFVVGYSFSSNSEPIVEIVDRLRSAANRGCRVWVALHHHHYNLERFKRLWGENGPPFELYYWNVPEENVSLHAKLLLVDEQDFLITSANLTEHGMKKNIEIGLRYSGVLIPTKIKEHLLNLVKEKILIRF